MALSTTDPKVIAQLDVTGPTIKLEIAKELSAVETTKVVKLLQVIPEFILTTTPDTEKDKGQ